MNKDEKRDEDAIKTKKLKKDKTGRIVKPFEIDDEDEETVEISQEQIDKMIKNQDGKSE